MHLLALKFPAFDPVALQLGPIAIKWYGLAYVAGLLLGWLYIRRLLSEGRLWAGGKAPLEPDIADDLFLFVALGVVLGGRLGNVLLWDFGFYSKNPMEILKVWKGGMAFHGGLVGVIVSAWLFSRLRHVRLATMLDLVAAAVPIGLFFGRLANFINAEIVGSASTVPWAMAFPGYGPDLRHPVQLYEVALEGVALFLLLRFLTHAKDALKYPGLVGGAFLAGYGGFRMFCEMFKLDEYQAFGWLPRGMAYCVAMVIAGVLIVRLALAKGEAGEAKA